MSKRWAVAGVICIGTGMIVSGWILDKRLVSSPQAAQSDVAVVSGGIFTGPTVWHDHVRHVTCWEHGGGMSCLPDWQLTPPEHEE